MFQDLSGQEWNGVCQVPDAGVGKCKGDSRGSEGTVWTTEASL